MDVRELYRTALERTLADKPRGTQGLMADHFGIKRSRMNDYVKGRVSIPENKRVAFANYLGHSYEEMISLGRRLTAGEERSDWPHASEAEHYGDHSQGRAYFVWEKGCEYMGIPGVYDRQAHGDFIERTFS